ncbi:MAG: hypothetical protein ABI763_00470 [Bacteroidota bacterium]
MTKDTHCDLRQPKVSSSFLYSSFETSFNKKLIVIVSTSFRFAHKKYQS